MAVSPIRHPPAYKAPATPPPKPAEPPVKAEPYWQAKPSAPPKKHSEHKVDIKA